MFTNMRTALFEKETWKEKPPRLKWSKMLRIFKEIFADMDCTHFTRLLGLPRHYLMKCQELRILRKSSENRDFASELKGFETLFQEQSLDSRNIVSYSVLNLRLNRDLPKIETESRLWTESVPKIETESRLCFWNKVPNPLIPETKSRFSELVLSILDSRNKVSILRILDSWNKVLIQLRESRVCFRD